MFKRSPLPSCCLKRLLCHPQDEKPSSVTHPQLEDKPGKHDAWPCPPFSWPYPSALGCNPLVVCSAPVPALGSPSTSQLFFTWPFSFTGIRENTAVLSVRKGKNDKVSEAVQQGSNSELSANLVYLQEPLLFINFTKRKPESYFRCTAKKLPPFQRN